MPILIQACLANSAAALFFVYESVSVFVRIPNNTQLVVVLVPLITFATIKAEAFGPSKVLLKDPSSHCEPANSITGLKLSPVATYRGFEPITVLA